MAVVLALPPLTQLNAPYPSILFLARALRDAGEEVRLRDLGIELALRLFSREGLEAVFAEVEARAGGGLPEPAWRALALRERHLEVIDPVVRFLQGRDPGLAPLLVRPGFLPAGPRLARFDPSAFGRAGLQDAARHAATLHLADLADLVRAVVDPGFELASYERRLATGPADFGPLARRLERTTLLDRWIDELADDLLAGGDVELVGLSVPFPGTLAAALRIGRRLRARGVPVVMGGGWPSTELRNLSEPRIWEYVDAVVYDEGSEPLLAILEHLRGGPDRRHRTRTAEGAHRLDAPSQVVVHAGWHADLRLDRYLRVLDDPNPAHRLWSEARWNKLLVAHGCYWRRCAFCDTGLDYVARYRPGRAAHLADLMGELVRETGERGFHLVDEAAPPRVLRDLAVELLARGQRISWWGNVRFERAFTPDLARLLAAAGLVAVTGGLEAAQDRLLELMGKGVRVGEAARVCAAFRRAGVRVHAYLMVGFPSQTVQEIVDSAEIVRQLFAEGALDSAFWHRFVLTRHSPVFADPARYGVRVVRAGRFAENDLDHEDVAGGADPRPWEPGLERALAAWMRGRGLRRPVRRWFDRPAPPPSVPRDLVRRALAAPPPEPGDRARLVWVGGEVLEAPDGSLVLHHAAGAERVRGPAAVLDWLAEVIDAARPGGDAPTLGEVRAAAPGEWAAVRGAWRRARRAGLLAV